MTVRPMRWWDVEAAAALERELFEHAPWSEEQFWAELAHVPETRWFAVHEDDDGIDGYVCLAVVPPDGDVQTIAIAPRSQGRGLGRALLGALLDEAQRRGCSQVFLEVLVTNGPAISLYEKFGFERQGQRRDYYGPGVDALVMRKRFRDAGTSE